MNLKYIIYLLTISFFSCIESTLIADKDCAGNIGGEALVDDCGVCGGPGLTGCDSTCGSTLQLDCAGDCDGNNIVDCDSICIHIDLAKQFDFCGICDGDNSTCSGCTNPDACNYDSTSTVYSDCEASNYYCEYDSDNELLDLNTLDFNKKCDIIDEAHYCGPGADACKFVNCNDTINFGYIGTVIDCNRKLPICDTLFTDDEIDELICIDYITDFMGDIDQENGGCDFTITNCIEFDWDGNDCNLVDCLGNHFSDSICAEINNGKSCIEGESAWLGDGACDEGDNDLELNFNCIEWNYDGGDCVTFPGRIENINKLNSKFLGTL